MGVWRTSYFKFFPKMETLQATQRLSYIDTTKTICIFLMIVGHWSTNNILNTYIYSFHMPAFFIISGMFYKPHSALKTIKAFSIPVFVFSTVNLLILFMSGKVYATDLSLFFIVREYLQYRHGMELTLFKGVWFVWVLVTMRLIFGLFPLFRKKRVYYIFVAIVCVGYMTFVNYLIGIDTLFKGYYIGHVIPSLPFFCFGFLLKDSHWAPQNLSVKQITLFGSIFIFMPLMNGQLDIYNNAWGRNYLMSFVIAILSSLFLFWLSSNIPPSKFAETISKGTLIILGVHWPILCILNNFLPSSLKFLFPFITIIVCYYIIIFCERFCPILLGKIKH